MFKLARSIVRHKVGVVAVIAFGVFMFSRGGQDDSAKPASPWSHQATVASAQSATSDKDSIVDKAIGKASEFIGETTGINPEELTEQSVGNFNKTNDAFADAKKR